jgi:hypothetical protein
MDANGRGVHSPLTNKHLTRNFSEDPELIYPNSRHNWSSSPLSFTSSNNPPSTLIHCAFAFLTVVTLFNAYTERCQLVLCCDNHGYRSRGIRYIPRRLLLCKSAPCFWSFNLHPDCQTGRLVHLFKPTRRPHTRSSIHLPAFDQLL